MFFGLNAAIYVIYSFNKLAQCAETWNYFLEIAKTEKLWDQHDLLFAQEEKGTKTKSRRRILCGIH